MHPLYASFPQITLALLSKHYCTYLDRMYLEFPTAFEMDTFHRIRAAGQENGRWHLVNCLIVWCLSCSAGRGRVGAASVGETDHAGRPRCTAAASPKWPNSSAPRQLLAPLCNASQRFTAPLKPNTVALCNTLYYYRAPLVQFYSVQCETRQLPSSQLAAILCRPAAKTAPAKCV
jgi:hypothetical protein